MKTGLAGARASLLVSLLLATVSTALLLRAWLAPPSGTVFVGTFAYVDDFYNYLGQAEQAQRGVLVFKSKLASPTLPPALVNVEWLAVGWLGALLGGRLVLAYRVFGLLASATLVLLTDRWLARCGLPEERRLSGLLLVFTGGGLGGLAFALGLLPGERAFDLRTGAYPFVQALLNPHFVAGTTLLAAALLAFAARRTRVAAALGILLALVRPYDAGLLVAVEGAAVLLEARASEWPRRLLPVVATVPALAYDAWVFLASPGYRVWANKDYGRLVPTAAELSLALGPAALLALTALRAPRDESGQAHLLRLVLWAGVALAAVVLQPASFALQFVVGIGLPLLAIAAVGLARQRARILALALPLMATNAVVLVWLCLQPTPRTHPPRPWWAAARVLRGLCRPGQVLFAPAEIGLLAGGLTSCWPFVSHPAAPDHSARRDEVRWFYQPQRAPAQRSLFLDRTCPDHLVLPAFADAGWLGGAPYSRRFTVGGTTGPLAVWSRTAACRAPS